MPPTAQLEPRKYCIIAERNAFDDWKFDHYAAAEQAERKLAYPDAVEILSDLEDQLADALKIGAGSHVYTGIALIAVSKWQEKRRKQAGI